MATVADFINKAKAEIGYTETPVNNNKFAAIAGNENYAPWCQIFLNAIAKQVGLVVPHTSSSTLYTLDGFRGRGKWFSSPQVGDYAYFNFDGTSVSGTDHVGVVVAYDSRTVTTIDGNTSRPDGVNVNGGGVWQRIRSRSYVTGYGRPDYTSVGSLPPPPAPASVDVIKTDHPVAGMAACATGGYWQVATDGGVFAFGGAGFYGSLGGLPLNKPIVGMAGHPSGRGYWLVASDGGVFSFGASKFLGSTGNIKLNKPIVGMAAHPSGEGYWLVAADGGLFGFNAPFLGSTGNITLNKPVVGMAPTKLGAGYWLAASDGGIFSYGDAKFEGSTGGITLNKPIVGVAGDPDGRGYWLAASDGGVFNFEAPFYGSLGGKTLNKPVKGIVATPKGLGYWLYAEDGGVFSFGDAAYLGSVSGL